MLGGPVWRLPQHSAVYNRPVHQLRPGQVGSSQWDRPALATRNGRNGEGHGLAHEGNAGCVPSSAAVKAKGLGDPVVIQSRGRNTLFSTLDCLSAAEKNMDRLISKNQRKLRSISKLLALCP